MKHFVIILLILTGRIGFSWILNPSVPNIVTYPVLIEGNNLEQSSMFKDTNGDLHVVSFYNSLSDLSAPVQLFDANITQQTSRLTNAIGAGGRIIGQVGAVFSNGWLYRGTSDNNSTSQAFRYHPISGKTEFLHQGAAKTLYSCCISDDGWITWANFGKAGVERYNPADGTWQNFGPSDTNYTGAAHYGYTVGADNRYVYVGVGEQPWYLAVMDTQTGTSWTYWSNLTMTAGMVLQGASGGHYYSSTGNPSGNFYQLINGVPVLTNSVPTVISYLTNYGTYYNQGSVFTDVSGLDFDFSSAYPDSSNNVATLRWANTGTTNWIGTSVSGFNFDPAYLRRVYANDDSSLFVIPVNYVLPVMNFAPHSQVVSVLGRTGSSLYDAVNSSGLWYLSGYSAISYRYNPAIAWTLLPATPNDTDPSINPRAFSGGGFGKYHYYSCFGSDGYLYIGAHHERDSVGGEIGWYNVSTMAKVGSLRDPFIDIVNDVRDLKPVLAGTKLIYLSSGTNQLFVFDVSTKANTITNNSIFPQLATLGKCVEVSSGILVGVSGSSIWKYDVSSNSLLYTNSLPGTSWSGMLSYDQRLTLGPDGFVWVTLGNDLYRIDPNTCIPELIKSAVGAANVIFNSGTAYLYNPASAQLKSLDNLLLSSGTATIVTATFNTVIFGQ